MFVHIVWSLFLDMFHTVSHIVSLNIEHRYCLSLQQTKLVICATTWTTTAASTMTAALGSIQDSSTTTICTTTSTTMKIIIVISISISISTTIDPGPLESCKLGQLVTQMSLESP